MKISVFHRNRLSASFEIIHSSQHLRCRFEEIILKPETIGKMDGVSETSTRSTE